MISRLPLLATLATPFACGGFDALGAELKEVPRERTMIPDCLTFSVCTEHIKDYNTFNLSLEWSDSQQHYGIVLSTAQLVSCWNRFQASTQGRATHLSNLATQVYICDKRFAGEAFDQSLRSKADGGDYARQGLDQGHRGDLDQGPCAAQDNGGYLPDLRRSLVRRARQRDGLDRVRRS